MGYIMGYIWDIREEYKVVEITKTYEKTEISDRSRNTLQLKDSSKGKDGLVN